MLTLAVLNTLGHLEASHRESARQKPTSSVRISLRMILHKIAVQCREKFVGGSECVTSHKAVQHFVCVCVSVCVFAFLLLNIFLHEAAQRQINVYISCTKYREFW